MKIFKIIAAASFVAMSVIPARAQMQVGVPVAPLGYCQIASATLAASTGLSSCAGGIPAGANMIMMQAEAQNIRYRDDGTAPTAAIGQLLVSGQNPMLYTGTLGALRFIDATAGGILDVTFYKAP